jgi:GTP-binding protein YchF
LVKGAAQGEGLGNKFLSHIRQTNAIVHVLRAFDDPEVVREGAVDPATDLATIRTELQLADLSTLEKQAEPKGKVDPQEATRWQVVQQLTDWIQAGVCIAAHHGFDPGHLQWEDISHVAKELVLITAKPELMVVNVDETALAQGVDALAEEYAQRLGVDAQQVIVMCNQIESELSSLSDQDQALYLEDLGLEQSGLERLIVSAYRTLELQSFLTAGEKEVRAWTIKQGTTAQQAAGVIHTDFAKKFIKAQVANYHDFIEYGGWKQLREAGKVRQEGRDYIMQPDDVVEFAVGS